MTTSSMRSLSACALFVAPRLCSTKMRRNKKSADNIRRRHRAVRRQGKFCCVSVVGNFVACRSSALYCHRRSLPSERQRKKADESEIFVGVLASAFSRRRSNANERRQRSVCRAFRYVRFGGEAQGVGVLPVAGGFERGVPVAGGSETGGSDGGWTQAHCNNKAPPSLCCVLLLMATTRRNKKSPEHRAGNLFGRIRTSSSLVSRPTLLTTVE
jgi:hypothetical protein